MGKRGSVLGARAAGARLERVRGSGRFRDGRFHNTAPVGPGLKGNPLPTLGEYFFGGQRRAPPGPLPQHQPLPTLARPPETGLRVTWLGHSTMLLEVDGVRVLTDPVFGDRASPLAFAGPRRFHPVPLALAELPELDAVLVSHDHYDHLCAGTIAELARRQVPFITSLGVGAHLEAWGVRADLITELDWWEHASIRGGALRMTATPAQHFSGRGMGDRNQTSWSSWVLTSDHHQLFFSGDTGLTDEFKQIHARLGRFDLVMLEVGAWHPSWGDIHLGPENALRAHQMLGGGLLMPVHWGTFNLALHAWDEPGETLHRLAQEHKVRLLTPRLGAPAEPARVELTDPWWREVTDSAAARVAEGSPLKQSAP